MKLKNFMCWIVALLAVSLLGSCSRSVQEEQPVKKDVSPPQTQVLVPGPAVSTPVTRSQQPIKPASEETTYSTDGELPIRLCTLLQDKESGRAGLVDRRSGKQVMVRQGQIFSGYEVIKIDVRNEQVVLRKDGKEYSLTVSESGFGDQLAAPLAPALVPQTNVAQNPPMRKDSANMFPQSVSINELPPPEHFEPTPEERAAGIDPNNPATWPKEYRGPGIERALREQAQKAAGSGEIAGQ
jgi:hypothetical protein